MTTEPATGLPRPSDLEGGDPDVDFRLGVGVYVGAVALGVAATAAAWARPAAAATIGLLAGSFVLGSVVGSVVAGRLPGLAVAIGYRRRRRLATLVPAAAFGILAVATLLEPAAGGAMVLAAFFAACATGMTGLLVAAMAHNRYVAAAVDDDPAVAFTWSRAGPFRWEYASGATFLALGLGYAASDDWGFAAMWAGYGAFWLLFPFLEGRWVDPEDLGTTPQLSVHDVGLVKSRGRTKSLVPWNAITGVRLTDDELVLERRFRDIRCTRDAIDDPEAARDAIERVRSRGLDRSETRGGAAVG